MKKEQIIKRLNKNNKPLTKEEFVVRFDKNSTITLDREINKEEALLLFTTDLIMFTVIIDSKGNKFIYEYLID